MEGFFGFQGDPSFFKNAQKSLNLLEQLKWSIVLVRTYVKSERI